MSTNWKNTSYNSILIIIGWLTKMLHYNPVQITIDKPDFAKVFIDLVAQNFNLPDLIISD